MRRFSKTIFVTLALTFSGVTGYASPSIEELWADVQELRASLDQLDTGGVDGFDESGNNATTQERIETLDQHITALRQDHSAAVDNLGERISILEARICQIDPLCGVSQVENVTNTEIGETGLAAQEQQMLERATVSFHSGDTLIARDEVDAFLASFPTGPLTVEAFYLKGLIEDELGNPNEAIKGYLESYGLDPEGPLAGDSLLGLANALNVAGKVDPACLTLAEVTAKFRGTMVADIAATRIDTLNCQ